METIVKLVQEKAGLSEEQAKEAVTTVLAFVKERLPEPIAGQLDGLLSGEVDVNNLMSQAQGLMGNLGGMFGKKE